MSKFGTLALEGVDTPTRMTIRHPYTNLPLRDKEGGEAYVELYSADSEVAVRERRVITNGRLAMRNRTKITGERLETEQAELLAVLTTGWCLVDLVGDPIDLPFTRQAALELYGDHRMAWLREQVDEFAADRANFSQASSTS